MISFFVPELKFNRMWLGETRFGQNPMFTSCQLDEDCDKVWATCNEMFLLIIDFWEASQTCQNAGFVDL
jgi:hypothetical protein